MATKRNQPHRSGAVVMRGAEKRPTEDQQLLQQEASDSDFAKTDTWRALRILGDEVLSELRWTRHAMLCCKRSFISAKHFATATSCGFMSIERVL